MRTTSQRVTMQGQWGNNARPPRLTAPKRAARGCWRLELSPPLDCETPPFPWGNVCSRSLQPRCRWIAGDSSPRAGYTCPSTWNSRCSSVRRWGGLRTGSCTGRSDAAWSACSVDWCPDGPVGTYRSSTPRPTRTPRYWTCSWTLPGGQKYTRGSNVNGLG